TTVGSHTSVLFRTLNAAAPTAAWQREALRAFQTWAIQANINIGLVADGGQPGGSPGQPQGDPRFGDIRLGAYAMLPGDPATARGDLPIPSPSDEPAGTWSGDVKLNTTYNFGIGGAGTYDLYTVLLHEAAPPLGLDHSADPASAVYEGYL